MSCFTRCALRVALNQHNLAELKDPRMLRSSTMPDSNVTQKEVVTGSVQATMIRRASAIMQGVEPLPPAKVDPDQSSKLLQNSSSREEANEDEEALDETEIGLIISNAVLEAVNNAIATANTLLVALDDWREPTPLSRIWCLYEVSVSWSLSIHGHFMELCRYGKLAE